VLKLKTADFKIRTRSATLQDATLLADRIFAAARPMLQKEVTGTAFRLLGVGISHLEPAKDEITLDATAMARAKAEKAVDALRAKFGRVAVERGLAFEREQEED
jgi:DNA polymerase-4